ncbi:MAG TPA: hypothetical protein V6D17_00705 [Candidatus Obscuribacterales bacterium]
MKRRFAILSLLAGLLVGFTAMGTPAQASHWDDWRFSYYGPYYGSYYTPYSGQVYVSPSFSTYVNPYYGYPYYRYRDRVNWRGLVGDILWNLGL